VWQALFMTVPDQKGTDLITMWPFSWLHAGHCVVSHMYTRGSFPIRQRPLSTQLPCWYVVIHSTQFSTSTQRSRCDNRLHASAGEYQCNYYYHGTSMPTTAGTPTSYCTF
jgi:hypothetical protein